MKARKLREVFSYRVATRRCCLSRLMNRSTRFLALYRNLSKARGCFRFTLEGITASAPLDSIVLTNGSLSYALSAITAEGE